MKKLKLSHKQMENLLEMCRVLFPEFDVIEYDKPTLFILFYSKGRKQEHIYSHRIYWYELCLLEIPEKIFFSNIKRNSKEDYLNFVWDSNLFWENNSKLSSFADHPVDYLYKQFKKLHNV